MSTVSDLDTHPLTIKRRNMQAFQDPTEQLAQENLYLRQRVAELEAALAATENSASVTSISTNEAAPASSEFATSTEPAVQAAEGEAAAASSQPRVSAFQEAWEEDDNSFEARYAKRAFFHAGSVDEESRSWLLGS